LSDVFDMQTLKHIHTNWRITLEKTQRQFY